jgi:hypothetical protein
VIKCGESSSEALQLAVVRALLTFTTAGACVRVCVCVCVCERVVSG